jgi:hypothetical protein
MKSQILNRSKSVNNTRNFPDNNINSFNKTNTEKNFQESLIEGTNASPPEKQTQRKKSIKPNSVNKKKNQPVVCEVCGAVKLNKFHVCNLNADEKLPSQNESINKSIINKSSIINNSKTNNVIQEKPNPKKVLTGKEIQKKLEDYKKKLNSDLLKVLSEEKFKEEERDLLYNKTTNPIEKKRLEKIIAMERAQSSEKIMLMNE